MTGEVVNNEMHNQVPDVSKELVCSDKPKNLKKEGKKMDEVKKLAIDLGSANLKIAAKINGEYRFHKIKSRVSINAIDTNYVVHTSNNTFCFGIGDSLIQQDKTKREYIEETILLAASLMFGDNLDDGVVKIDLAIGLPLDLYKSPSKLESFEMKINAMTNKSISGNVNGKDIVVKVVSYKICAECYSGFIALNHRVDSTIPFVIIDSGYRTTDVLSVDVRPVDGKPEFIIGEYKTFNKGLFEIFDDIQKQFLNDTGLNYDINIIENRILNSPMMKIGERKVNIGDWVEYGRHTVKEIIKSIELSIPDVASRNVYIIGGGASLFNEISNGLCRAGETIVDTQVLGDIDQLIYANVIGYYMQIGLS